MPNKNLNKPLIAQSLLKILILSKMLPLKRSCTIDHGLIFVKIFKMPVGKQKILYTNCMPDILVAQKSNKSGLILPNPTFLHFVYPQLRCKQYRLDDGTSHA
jgi:hypothetical protein